MSGASETFETFECEPVMSNTEARQKCRSGSDAYWYYCGTVAGVSFVAAILACFLHVNNVASDNDENYGYVVAWDRPLLAGYSTSDPTVPHSTNGTENYPYEFMAQITRKPVKLHLGWPMGIVFGITAICSVFQLFPKALGLGSKFWHIIDTALTSSLLIMIMLLITGIALEMNVIAFVILINLGIQFSDRFKRKPLTKGERQMLQRKQQTSNVSPGVCGYLYRGKALLMLLALWGIFLAQAVHSHPKNRPRVDVWDGFRLMWLPCAVVHFGTTLMRYVSCGFRKDFQIWESLAWLVHKVLFLVILIFASPHARQLNA